VADTLTPLTTLAEWTGRDTSVAEVLRQLAGLRRQAQRKAASRTSVVTLVVMATSAVDAWDALATVHRFGGRHPARSVVVVAEPKADKRLDARVSLTEAKAGGHGVWFEDIVLSVAGPAARHLSSLLEPFTLPDLPVAVWYVGGPPDPADDLLRAADAVLVDSKVAVGEEGGDSRADGDAGSLPNQATLRAIAELFGTRAVVDLAWYRLSPWRDLLAGLFDAAVFRPHLHHLTSVEVMGKPGPRGLLSGWLTSRLDVAPGRLHLVDARHASVTLISDRDGTAGRFCVERVDGERLVRASASVDGGPSSVDVLALPDADLSWSLAEALGALRRNPSYEAAVLAAANA
jgi:glucose-6-phosphate dehydrogenase assembly protein OpcA